MPTLVTHEKDGWFRCMDCNKTVSSTEHDCQSATHVVSQEEEFKFQKG